MSKKLMLLAAGALSALAFAALPTMASAGEFEAHCTNGQASCTGTISSTVEATLTTDSGSIAEKIKCTGATSGTATQTSTSSTGTVQIVFSGCKDEVFGLACQNGAAGVISTNVLTSHLIRIDPISAEKPTGTPGVLLTGVNVTFTCNVGIKVTVTGSIIAHWSNPQCGVAAVSHTATFSATGNEQRFKQVTTAGPIFQLTTGTHASDTTAFVWVGSWAFNVPSTFTC